MQRKSFTASYNEQHTSDAVCSIQLIRRLLKRLQKFEFRAHMWARLMGDFVLWDLDNRCTFFEILPTDQ